MIVALIVLVMWVIKALIDLNNIYGYVFVCFTVMHILMSVTIPIDMCTQWLPG